MFRKKEVFSIISVLPPWIPRQLAIDILHSHSEVITLNPLVLDHKPIPPPRDVKDRDEYFSTWYEITERIQYIPGIGKIGAGNIKFNGCFHNMPWGLQTHIYAPANVDLKNKYMIAGNQQGVEPPQTLEIGLSSLGAPADGLYLREDIEIKANIAVVGFVKAQLQKAGGEMVKRIIKKAELLDAGVLQAMIENGKLKTVNPADRSQPLKSPVPSPTSLHHTPSILTPPPQSPALPYKALRPESYLPASGPGISGAPVHGYQGQQTGGYGPPAGASELAASATYSATNVMPVEMPGDFYHPQQSPRLSPHPSPGLPSHRDSTASAASERSRLSPDPSQSARWSNMDSRPASMASTATTSNGFPSPNLEHKGFSSELPTHQEIPEDSREYAFRRLDQRIPQPSHYPPYNPADYAYITEQHKRMQAGYAQQGSTTSHGP
jgi:hypothetical protein